MSVHKTAYDTTACAGFQMRKTVEALQEAAIKGWLSYLEGTAVRAVEGAGGSDEAIPAFAHPILFDNAHKEPMMAVDVRSFGKVQVSGQFVIRNAAEYAMARTRARLNWVWIKDAPSLLRDVSHLPLQVYCAWVSESLTRRFALNPEEQYKLSIYAGIFYLSNFIAGADYNFSEEDKVRVAQLLSRALRVKAEDVLKVMDADTDATTGHGQGCPVIANAIHFCNVISGLSVRLQSINVGLLFSVLGGTWYGTNAKEMVAVALEHPPTWLTIVLAAVNERSFKNSGVTKITERSGYREGVRTYQAALLNMLASAASSGADLSAPGF